MTKTQAIESEMPTLDDLRDKVSFELFSCKEFAIQGVLFPGNKLHVHSDWPQPRRLTPSLLKKALRAIALIRESCKENGIPAFYCLVPVSLEKWEQILGFHTIDEFINHLGGENIVLMKQECP